MSETRAGHFSEYTYAVIVGISDYAVPLTSLPACAPEARALADILTKSAGCAVPVENVRLIPPAEATASNILSIMSSVVDQCGTEDTLFVYFAGHGIDDASGFLLCTGSNDSEAGISANDIEAVLTGARVRGVFFTVDCCGGAALAESVPNFFRILDNSEFRLFISASRARQSSWELSEEQKSLFTQHLLLALAGNDEVGTNGAIYFTDLFGYLHTAVQEAAQVHLGSSQLQEPVFAGTFGKDPLLFLHKDLTLAATRVRAQRITRSHLRQKIRATVVTIVSLIVIGIGAYWTFQENHQYLDLDEERVTLYHGYPGLSGFGLPDTVWEFDFGPVSMTHESPPLVVPRPFDVYGAIARILTPSAHAELYLLMGDKKRANRLLRAAIENAAEPNVAALELLPAVVAPGDEGWLSQQVVSARPEHAGAFITALARLDGEKAAEALKGSSINDNFGYQLNLLSNWSTQCGPATQAWFESFLNREDVWVPVSTVALASIRAMCSFPAEKAYLVNDNFLQAALTATRLTAPADSESLGAEVLAELSRTVNTLNELDPWNPALPSKYFQLTTRLLYIARALGDGICIPDLLNRIPDEPLEPASVTARRHLLVLLLRGCRGAVVRVEVGIVAQSVYLSADSLTDTQVLYLPTDPEIDSSVLASMDILIEADAQGVILALTDLLDRTSNPELRLALVRRLRRLSADGSDALQYFLPEQYMLERELIRWLYATDASAASEYLVSRLLVDQDSTLLETLAFVDLQPDDRDTLLKATPHFGVFEKVVTLTLAGDSSTTVDLLHSLKSTFRNVAAVYAPIRKDWEAIRREVEAPPYVAQAALAVHRVSVAMADIESQLENAPEWARPWLAKILDHQAISEPAVALRLEQLRDDMHILWLSSQT